MDQQRVLDAAAAAGLHHGRMVSYSKGWFIRNFPHRAVLFNAHITDEAGEDLWSGDLDLTVDEPALLDLAEAVGEALFVMAEAPFIHGLVGAALSPAERAVLVVRPDRTSSQPERTELPFDREDGRLVVPRAWRRAPPGPESPGDDSDDNPDSDSRVTADDEETP